MVGPCDSAPCRNNAACTNVGVDYQCTCTSQYTGRNCDIVRSGMSYILLNCIVCEWGQPVGVYSVSVLFVYILYFCVSFCIHSVLYLSVSLWILSLFWCPKCNDIYVHVCHGLCVGVWAIY